MPLPTPGGDAGTWDTILNDYLNERLPATIGDYRTAVSWDEDGTPQLAGIAVSPLLFGAVGDGVTDDSAAFANYLDALGIGVAGDNVGNGIGVILDGHNRDYLITEPVLISRCWFVTMRNFTFVVGAPIEAGLDLYGVSYATFENILVRGQAWSAVNTCDYPFRLESAQLDPGVAKPPTAGLSFINCSVLDVKHKVAFAVGMDSANLQVSETKFFSCHAIGQYDLDAPDATWYQAGWHVGSGTAGNVLNHQCFGCDANAYKYPVHVDNTDMKWWGGAIQGGDAAVFHASSNHLIVSGVRSEGSRRLLDTGSGTDTVPHILLENIQFDCNELHADGYVVRMHYRSMLRVSGMNISAVTPPATPQIRFNHAVVTMGYIVDVSCPTPVEHFLSYTGGTPHGVLIGYTETDPDDGSVVTTTPGPVLISQTALQMLTPGNPIDGNLYRKTSLGYPFTDYRFGSALGFDVRAAATYDQSFRTFVGADSVARLIIDGDGALEWGPGGAGASDIKLERTGNSVLSLGADDVFKTGQNVTGSRPSAATVGAGAQFYDTTLSKPIWSNGTVWKDAAGNTV
jgi:hypothetical protein